MKTLVKTLSLVAIASTFLFDSMAEADFRKLHREFGVSIKVRRNGKLMPYANQPFKLKGFVDYYLDGQSSAKRIYGVDGPGLTLQTDAKGEWHDTADIVFRDDSSKIATVMARHEVTVTIEGKTYNKTYDKSIDKHQFGSVMPYKDDNDMSLYFNAGSLTSGAVLTNKSYTTIELGVGSTGPQSEPGKKADALIVK